MQKEDIRLRQVIIHIMDSTMGMPVLSDQVIDFGSDFGDFLRAHIFRLLESDDMKKCSFDEDSKVQAELEAMFDRQYSLTTREVVEIRTRTVTSTDPETGETTEDEEEYEYYILYVTLRNKGFGAVALENLDEEQKERYTATLSLKGNKPYLFGSDIYANESTGEDYDLPGQAMADPDFAALIAEAEKYLGFPYVWGGSSPSTSFDCSGFVCYVYTHSGVHNLPRTTAQGIYNQCAHIPMSEAKPGDIIFFTGTSNSPGPVSHVGIYVGNNMMIHCGSPIQYARTDSSYWSQHFYAIGRLN